MTMFNEYGAATEVLGDFSNFIHREFEKFLEDNNIDNAIEIRAVSNYVESSIQIVADELVLKIAMKKRKENNESSIRTTDKEI